MSDSRPAKTASQASININQLTSQLDDNHPVKREPQATTTQAAASPTRAAGASPTNNMRPSPTRANFTPTLSFGQVSHTIQPSSPAATTTAPGSIPHAVTTRQIRQTITCKFWMQGYCYRGTSCHYAHHSPGGSSGGSSATLAATDQQSSATTTEETPECGICLEVPTKWGLLETCSHSFCFPCIRDWRESKKEERERGAKEETDCPLCREKSCFITPSSRFFPQGSDKERATKAYKDKMKSTPCKYLAKSMGEGRLHCPFRNDCYYSHVLDSSGIPYTFPPPRPRRDNFQNLIRGMRPEDLEVLIELFARADAGEWGLRDDGENWSDEEDQEDDDDDEDDEDEDEDYDDEDYGEWGYRGEDLTWT
ncbi:hypothetical protein T439DRAFT_348589 [Meredithblackwellia eburnea MCA 4105]